MTEPKSEESKPPAPPIAPAPDVGADLQRRLVELEKRLQEEKEKVLLSSLRTQEEANYASKVESAIKDVQDKLRRDRREAELEEGRLKLEGKIRDLEARLVQERETWVATLQEQIKARESQDKEIETHFVGRVEEMERRWLEEKAHWQKLVMAKDDEIRNLKISSERLKTLEIDAQKLAQEKNFLEEKVQQSSGLKAQAEASAERLKSLEMESQKLAQEKRFLEEKVQSLGPLQNRLQALEDKEKESFQVKAELSMAKEQAQNVRAAAREREERLLSENERLHHEVQAVVGRMRVENEGEVRRLKSELGLAAASVQKLRAVAGALERQRTAFRAQVDQLLRYKKGLEQGHDRAKAELLMIQRKWEENELRIRREAEAATRDAVKDEVRRELVDEWHKQEDALRKSAEEAQAALGQRLEARIQALHEQAEALEAKLKAKTEENVAAQDRLAQLESAKSQLEAEKARLQEEGVRLGALISDADAIKRTELEALSARHLEDQRAQAERLERAEESWKQGQEEARQALAKTERALEEASKSLEDAQAQALKARQDAQEQNASRQAEIARLNSLLSDEQKKIEESEKFKGELEAIRREDWERAQAAVGESRKSLQEAQDESAARQEEISKLQARLKEEQDLLEQSRRVRKEGELSWSTEKAELERKVAQLKEQLENFSEVSRMNMEAARRDLEARVAVLEDEIEDYRKPKPGLLEKVLGQAKPKPPKAPSLGQAPSPPAAPVLPPPPPQLPPSSEEQSEK